MKPTKILQSLGTLFIKKNKFTAWLLTCALAFAAVAACPPVEALAASLSPRTTQSFPIGAEPDGSGGYIAGGVSSSYFTLPEGYETATFYLLTVGRWYGNDFDIVYFNESSGTVGEDSFDFFIGPEGPSQAIQYHSKAKHPDITCRLGGPQSFYFPAEGVSVIAVPIIITVPAGLPAGSYQLVSFEQHTSVGYAFRHRTNTSVSLHVTPSEDGEDDPTLTGGETDGDGDGDGDTTGSGDNTTGGDSEQEPPKEEPKEPKPLEISYSIFTSNNDGFDSDIFKKGSDGLYTVHQLPKESFERLLGTWAVGHAQGMEVAEIMATLGRKIEGDNFGERWLSFKDKYTTLFKQGAGLVSGALGEIIGLYDLVNSSLTNEFTPAGGTNPAEFELLVRLHNPNEFEITDYTISIPPPRYLYPSIGTFDMPVYNWADELDTAPIKAGEDQYFTRKFTFNVLPDVYDTLYDYNAYGEWLPYKETWRPESMSRDCGSITIKCEYTVPGGDERIPSEIETAKFVIKRESNVRWIRSDRQEIYACPVNVLIYDAAGKLLTTVETDDKEVYISDDGGLIVFADGDVKYVYRQLDKASQYRIELEGTDDGSMNIYVLDIGNVTDDAVDVLTAAVFNDVPLTDGARFETETDGDSYQLFAVTEDNQHVEIKPGNESEMPIPDDDAQAPPVVVDDDPADTDTVVVGDDPADTDPVDTDPIDTDPIDADPVDTQPVDADPVDADPVDTDPVDTDPVDTQPVDSAPADSAPTDSAPTDSAPTDSTPADSAPSNSGSAGRGSSGRGSSDRGSSDRGSSGTDTTDSTPADVEETPVETPVVEETPAVDETTDEVIEEIAEVAIIPGPTAPSLPVNPFNDVRDTDWFYDAVIYAHNTGLIYGTAPATFSPKDSLTYAEAVKQAACLHQLYTAGSVTLADGSPSYESYADYAKANGIISADYNWNAAVTRRAYIEIFANALPNEAFTVLNNIINGVVPDIPADHPQAAAIYKLYGAGILEGVDETRRFNPDSNIMRCEVAAVIARILNAGMRIEFDK